MHTVRSNKKLAVIKCNSKMQARLLFSYLIDLERYKSMVPKWTAADLELKPHGGNNITQHP